MSWRDRGDSAALAAEPGAAYPWIQWVNRGGDLDPRHKRGGFLVTSENLALLGDPDLPGEPVMMNFSTGDAVTGVLMQVLEFSPIVSRFSWVVWENNREVRKPAYEDGARGKLQVLVLLKSESGPVGPVMITLKGTVGSDLNTVIKAHRQAVRQVTGGQGASCWFWTAALAGDPVVRGHGSASSKVTPIVPDARAEFDPDAAYIGDEAADMLEERWDEFEAWANAWGEQAQEQDADFDEAGIPPQQTQTPAPSTPGGNPLGDARIVWTDAWNELKGRGVVAPFLDNQWSASQILEAARFMERAISLVSQGVDKEEVKRGLEKALANI